MFRSTVIASVAVLWTAGCGAGAVVVPRTVAEMALPAEQEAQLAAQIDRELHQRFDVIEDPEIRQYVERVGQAVARPSAEERGPLDVHFEVIDDPNQLNAFAAPGGNIYIYSGMLLAAASEAELAAILAHEVAHVANRDIARQLVAQFGLQTLARMALGDEPGLVTQLATQLGGAGALAAHSRGQESAADEAAVRYVVEAGYDPQAMVRIFEKFSRLRQTSPGALEVFFSTHPPPGDRVEAIQQRVAEVGASGGRLGEESHSRMVQSLRQRHGARGR